LRSRSMIVSKKNWFIGFASIIAGTALITWAGARGIWAMLRPQEAGGHTPLIAQGIAGFAVAIVGFAQMVASTQEDASDEDRLASSTHVDRVCPWCGAAMTDGQPFCQLCEKQSG
jgi:hypothetical protein